MVKSGHSVTTSLTGAQKDQIREILDAQRERLRVDVVTKDLQLREGEEVHGDFAELADRNVRRYVTGTLLNQVGSELGRVEAALARLDRDEFGVCFDCAKSIEFQRLLAKPTVVRCRKCEESRNGESQVPGSLLDTPAVIHLFDPAD